MQAGEVRSRRGFCPQGRGLTKISASLPAQTKPNDPLRRLFQPASRIQKEILQTAEPLRTVAPTTLAPARPERKPPPVASPKQQTKIQTNIASAIRGPTTAALFEGEPFTTTADCLVATHPHCASPPRPQPKEAIQILPCHLEFMANIKDLLQNQDPSRACDKPLFTFALTKDAAKANEKVLESFNFNLPLALKAQRNSPLYFGSEFQPIEKLERIFALHPLWPLVKVYLRDGITFPLAPISEELRCKDCAYMISRGNHKSATTPAGLKLVREHMSADVDHGFALPLPMNCLQHFKTQCSIAPLGVQDQSSLSDDGVRIPKWRMTHDQTFPGEASKLSVNKRVLKEELPKCLYGHALLRMLHFIVDLRYKHPDRRILIGKFDLKAAFRRAHLSPESALESMSTLDDTLLVSLRLTFGGAPCPPTWSCISESICDLANDLIACPAWNHAEIQSPIQTMIPPPERLPENVPLGKAVKLAVHFPREEIGKTELFIDDYAPIALDVGNNVDRVACAVPLAIHTVGRQLSPNEPLPRDDLVSLSKLAAEGKMEETKIMLGWLINTRSMLLHLPLNKFNGWSKDILDAISRTIIDGSTLETMTGRLNHAAMALTNMRHFLNRLRKLAYVAAQCKWGKARLTQNVKDDLTLCLEFLALGRDGVSLNILVFAEPTHYYRSDACEHGLGGYSILSGKAWRFELPADCRGRTTINVLEFLGCVITVWIDILAGDIHPDACILSQTDSTSAAGWLRKSCFDEKQHLLAMQTARHLGSLLIKAKACLYSQWVEGEANGVSDILSRDHHLSNKEIVSLILTSCPEQVPFGIKLQPLPKEIASWLIFKLQEQPATTLSPKAPTRSKYALGSVGSNTCPPLDLVTTSSSTRSQEANATVSWEPSCKPSDKHASAQNVLAFLKRNNAEPPWTMWQRPSGLTTGLIPDTTATVDWRMFYNAN